MTLRIKKYYWETISPENSCFESFVIKNHFLAAPEKVTLQSVFLDLVFNPPHRISPFLLFPQYLSERQSFPKQSLRTRQLPTSSPKAGIYTEVALEFKAVLILSSPTFLLRKKHEQNGGENRDGQGKLVN